MKRKKEDEEEEGRCIQLSGKETSVVTCGGFISADISCKSDSLRDGNRIDGEQS